MKSYKTPEIDVIETLSLEAIAATVEVSDATWGDMEEDGKPEEL